MAALESGTELSWLKALLVVGTDPQSPAAVIWQGLCTGSWNWERAEASLGGN